MTNVNFQTRIMVPSNIISDTTAYLVKQGQKGFEGRVYWVAQLAGGQAKVLRIAIPEQIPRRTLFGVSVTVPQNANVMITRGLNKGEYIAVKVHSHPDKAYNSETDKNNPFLRHEGAISIIVPNFGRYGMANLENCAVCIFTKGQWNDLTQNKVQSLFEFI